MSKQGQGKMNGVGALIVVAIVAIVGIVLLQASAQNIGDVVNTDAVVNTNLATSEESSSAYITTYRAILDPVLFNGTGGDLIPSNNYTVTNNVVYNGGLSVQVTTASACPYANETWLVSGTGQPLTYDNSSGGRAVAGLIVIFMAIAILGVILLHVKNSYKD